MAKKTKKQTPESLDIIAKLKRSIKIFESQTIGADDLEYMATTAYEFFMITHWNMVDSIQDEVEKKEFVQTLCDTIFYNLQQTEFTDPE